MAITFFYAFKSHKLCDFVLVYTNSNHYLFQLITSIFCTAVKVFKKKCLFSDCCVYQFSNTTWANHYVLHKTTCPIWAFVLTFASELYLTTDTHACLKTILYPQISLPLSVFL